LLTRQQIEEFDAKLYELLAEAEALAVSDEQCVFDAWIRGHLCCCRANLYPYRHPEDIRQAGRDPILIPD
jgi:hypothetical protein